MKSLRVVSGKVREYCRVLEGRGRVWGVVKMLDRGVRAGGLRCRVCGRVQRTVVVWSGFDRGVFGREGYEGTGVVMMCL